MQTLDNSLYVPVVITSDSSQTVAVTLKAVLESVYLENKIPALFVSDATGLIMGRNANQLKLKEYYGDKTIRGYYLDSDVMYSGTSDYLKELTEKHDQNGTNFILPYKSKTGMWNVWNTRNERITDIKDVIGKRIGYAGLGFYYGNIFPDYEFLMTKGKSHYEVVGEDVNFFRYLHKTGAEIYCEMPSLAHIKEVQIW